MSDACFGVDWSSSIATGTETNTAASGTAALMAAIGRRPQFER